MINKIVKLNKKKSEHFCVSGATAELIECLAGEQEDPGSIPWKGETFFTLINPSRSEMVEISQVQSLPSPPPCIK